MGGDAGERQGWSLGFERGCDLEGAAIRHARTLSAGRPECIGTDDLSYG